MEQNYVNFTLIKEKIIKTDEVLNLLKKSQHECKEWKNKYRQSVLIMKRSELETNRFTKNIEELKLKQKSFEEENKSLTEQNAFLEERYNKQMLESMKTIKTLQDDLQMIQELKSEGSKSTDVNQNLNDQINDLVKENQKLTEKSKKEIKHLQNQNETYMKEMSELKSQIRTIQDNHNKDKQQVQILQKQISSLNISKEKYENLQQENENCTDELLKVKLELEQLKCTYNRKFHNTYIQTDDLEKKSTVSQTDFTYFNKEVHNSSIQTDGLCCSENISDKINPKQKSIFSKKETSHGKKEVNNTYAQTDHIGDICLYPKIAKESKFSQTNDVPKYSCKSLPATQHLHASVQTDIADEEKELHLSENKKLTHETELYEETLRFWKDEMKQPKINVFSHTDFTDSAIESAVQQDVDDILTEMMALPRLISPITFENNLMNKTTVLHPPNVPGIVVTPSHPTENTDNLLIESRKLDSNLNCANKTDSQSTTIEKEKLLKSLKSKNKMCFTYNDYIRQQTWLLRQRKLSFKKKLNQRRRKSTLPNDGLLNSLKALKKSNIKFIISNDSILPQSPNYYTNLYDDHKPELKVKPKLTKKPFNIATVSPQSIETLQCHSGGCKQMCMLVNKTPEGTELLGFFGIKPETVTPAVLYTEQRSTVNHSDSVDYKKSPKYFSPQLSSSYPTLLSPIHSTPMSSKSVKKLLFNSPQKSHNVGDITVNSNVSFYIDKIMEDRKNLSDFNKFFGTLPHNLSGEVISLQISNVKTENVPSDSVHLEAGVNSSDFLQNCSNLVIKTELPDNPILQKSPINEYPYQPPSHISDGNTGKSLRNSENFTNSSEDSHSTGNNIDENDRLCFVNDDCLDSSDTVPSPTYATQERYKSLNRCQADSLRKSKRLIYQSSPSSIIKRKRLKSLPLESSDSEEDTLESPKSPVDDFDKGINLEESLHLKLSDSDNSDNSVKSPESPVDNFEERMRKSEEENIVGDNEVNNPLGNEFSLNNSSKIKPPAKMLTSTNKPLATKKKKKPVSKLKSRILQQIKCTSRMMGNRKFSSVANCDILDNSDKIVSNSKDFKQISVHSSGESTISQTENINEDEGIVTDQSETQSVNSGDANNITDSSKLSQNSTNTSVEKTDGNKKIHIVQNILIPPKSKFAIDLLKNNRKQKKTNPSSDILCEILHNMDKDKPIVKKNVSKEVSDNIPVSIDDKNFRNNVLDIAEVLHSGIKFSNWQYKGMPSRDKSVIESKILQKGKNLPMKIVILLSRLYKSLDPECPIRDDVIYEFKKLDVEDIADVVLNQVSKDFEETPTMQYVDAPLMTKKQNLFLCLMLKLEKEKQQELTNTFLCRTEQFLFYKGCGVKSSVPIVRLYLAVCRLRGDITRVRKFLSDAFYLINDAAIIICFTVLTNWVDVMPKWENWQSFPLSKVIFQIIHLKTDNRPGLKLFPLKCLLAQYYGYPKERLNCDELFKELYLLYLNGPSVERELAIRLLLKNKPKPWVYEKLNQIFKPLVYKIPSENVNFKATVIIFMGKICQYFRPKVEAEEAYLTELRRWFLGLTEDGAPQLIVDSVHYVMEKLPKKKFDYRKKQININQN